MWKPQSLPPKMAQQFADRAKRGEADYVVDNIYDFYQGANRITLVCLDPPIGHIIKETPDQVKRRKSTKGELP
jgi:hypothetical protein